MRLIIVSGRSGSGKSTALDVLEDNGFYCIDNLPAGLLPDLAERALLQTELLHPQVAVSVDARNLPSQLKRFPELLDEVRARHIQCDVLYLDADEETLLKRFSETRRRHPLTTDSRSLAEAIAEYLAILGDRVKLYAVMREEFEAIESEFATPRVSVIAPAADGIDDEDLIEREEMVVTVTVQGYIKRTPLESFRAQGRGGKGRLYHSHHSAMDNGPVTDVLWEEHNDLITRSSTDNR